MGYQTLLVGLLSLNFGILFFDRNALNFLMPFVKPDLGLSNTQVGLTASALSFSWAIATLVIGAASDRSGRRKIFLIGATIAFSLCSVLSGLATSFLALLGARLLMGVADGGVAPISQSMTVLTVAPERRGLAMGVMQNFGSNLFGSFIAPVLLVAFATAYGWHTAFYITAIPGFLSALLLWLFVREPAAELRAVETEGLADRVRAVLADRNMVLCALMSVLLVSYLVVCWAFMPLFLTSVRGFSPATMGWLMSGLGIAATVGSFAVSGISDRFGRKPVMIAASFAGVVLPLAALYYGGSTWVLAGFFVVGWTLTGIFPLFMGTVPSESVDHRYMATAIALVMSVGEIFGGVLAPTLAGYAADAAGLAAPLWIMMGLCVAAGIAALGLRETAPRRLQKTSA
ncbi:MAG: MFS transporter [Rhizomicrobium sp.]